MRVLFVYKELPYPPHKSGSGLRAYQTLCALKELGHRVTLAVFYDEAAEEKYFDTVRNICTRFIPVKRERKSFGRILQGFFFPGYPLYRPNYYSKKMEDSIRVALTTESFDVAYVGQDHMAEYLPLIIDMPKILEATDAWNLCVESLLKCEKGWRKAYLIKQLKKIERHIAKYHPAFDSVVVVAQRDAQKLQDISSHIKASVIPMYADTEYFKPYYAEHDFPSLVFTGNMNYKPNIDAVIWFCRQVLPIIRKKNSSIKLYIVGRNPPPAITELSGNSNVIVTGEVLDTRPYLAKATVSICPMRQGGGIKIKSLEAMAMGKAVVSTSEGLYGIPDAVENGAAFCADRATEFIEKILLLIDSESLRRHTEDNARKLIEKNYSQKAFTQKIMTLFEEATCKKLTPAFSSVER